MILLAKITSNWECFQIGKFAVRTQEFFFSQTISRYTGDIRGPWRQCHFTHSVNNNIIKFMNSVFIVQEVKMI